MSDTASVEPPRPSKAMIQSLSSETQALSSASDIAYSDSPAASRPFALLPALAQHHDGLRMDAVVLHGIRRLVALHEVLERLHVGDLGDKRGRVRSVRVPKGAHGDSDGTEHLLALRRAQPVLNIVHFVGDHVRSHRGKSFRRLARSYESVGYSDSPAASRASARSRKSSCRMTRPCLKVNNW